MNWQPLLPTTSPKYMSNICFEASEAASRASSMHGPACRCSPAALQLGGCRQARAWGPLSSLAEEHVSGSFWGKTALGVHTSLVSLLGQLVGRGGGTENCRLLYFVYMAVYEDVAVQKALIQEPCICCLGRRAPVWPRGADPPPPHSPKSFS